MKSFRFLLAICLVSVSASLVAQPVFYQYDSSVKVFAYGAQRNLAWCGGFNNSQFTMGDLNHDGLQDLVVYDPWTGVRTFVNFGTATHPLFLFAPEYALNFPPIYDFLVLADYNCDGIPDLFHRGGTGYEVYTGYYNSANQLCFTFKQDLWYYNLIAGGPANAYVNPGDVPSVVDVDGDGDLDFVSYDVMGRTLYYYRNMRVELGLPCDSLVIHLEDQCWGKVLQQYWRAHILNYECDNSNLIVPKIGGAGKVTHSGNTPCLFDWDMDGDMDYIDGSVSFPNMTFLKNGRVDLGLSVDSMVYQDTLWNSVGGDTVVNLPTWPAAFNIDVDGDGKKDLVIAPNAPQGSENYKCVWLYKNNSTAGSPNWPYQSDTFLVDRSIDIGTAAYPVLFDYNMDGKPDLFVGSDGYFQPSGTLQSKMSLYLNTGTPGHPSFTLQTTDFDGLFANNYQGMAPAFGDIDNDGKPDMLIGHSDGTISYFHNTATSGSVTPNWVLNEAQLKDTAGTVINVGGNAAPCIYDVDKDGKPDLVIGSTFGYFVYYRNISTTAGALALVHVTDHLGAAQADPLTSYPNYSTPFIGKLDSTGVDYLLTGSNSGLLYQYSGIATGDTSAAYALVNGTYSYIDTLYNAYLHPGSNAAAFFYSYRSAPTVGDIAGDGSLDMIVGNIRGGLEFYKLKPYYPESLTNNAVPETGTVNVYPNPTDGLLNITWTGLKAEKVVILVADMEGRTLKNIEVAMPANGTSISVAQLPPGMYLCKLVGGGQRYYNKFTVTKATK